MRRVKAMRWNKIFLTCLLLCSVLLIAACRRAGIAGPTLQPTLTVTPRSTALPTIEPTQTPGSEENPVVLLINRPVGPSNSATNRATQAVETTFLNDAELTVDVNTVDLSADILAALCDVNSDDYITAWVDAMTFAAAQALDCVEPLLQATRGRGQTLTTGETIHLYVLESSTSRQVADFDETACRVHVTDAQTWMYPSLLYTANGLNPLTAFENIQDYETPEALLEAMLEEECSIFGMSESTFEEEANGQARTSIVALTPSVEVPYAIFVVANNVPLTLRESLTVAIMEMDGDSFETFIGAGGVQAYDPDTMDSLLDVLRSADYPLTQPIGGV